MTVVTETEWKAAHLALDALDDLYDQGADCLQVAARLRGQSGSLEDAFVLGHLERALVRLDEVGRDPAETHSHLALVATGSLRLCFG